MKHALLGREDEAVVDQQTIVFGVVFLRRTARGQTRQIRLKEIRHSTAFEVG